MAHRLTADDIKRYLGTQSDFDLELFVYRSLLERGIPAHHGGTYVDPVTGKSRQYDVRAIKELPNSNPTTCATSLAIECKSLSFEFPLIVHRVPRPDEDSYHEVIRSWGRSAMGERFAKTLRREYGPSLYRPGEMVAKKTAQVRWDPNKNSFTGGDTETYDKWSQALASAAGLIHDASEANITRGVDLFNMLVLPILVVSDETLWAVDYDESGMRAEPTLVESTTLFLGHKYKPINGVQYEISHLHIYTRKGFIDFLGELVVAKPAGIWDRGFTHTLKG